MAEVDFRSPMSTAKLLGNVWHGSHWDVHPPFGLKVLSWILTHGFRHLFRQNVCRITVNLILPSPLAWERPNNYRFGEVAQLEEWHLHLRAYDVWLFWHNLKNFMPHGHNRVATPKGRWTLTQWGSTMPKKRQCLGRLRKKAQYWTWLTARRHPNCYWILLNLLQTSANFAALPERSKEPIILSYTGSLNCLAGCRCWSFPRSLWDLAMAQIDWLNVTSCAPPGTAKIGTENGPQSGALLGAWLHVGPDTKSVT